ncbi:MAG: aldose 1-epimerase family protein [Candidatus Eremiobacteraeota bacterium]|nr:aldose 1-epimerase family protein [Candidatus Eremiobacteraeota bacterium]
MIAGICGGRSDPAELRRRMGDLSRLAGITPIVFSDGRAQGVHALELRSGSGLSATLVVDRALDALELTYCGIPLTWLGPGGLTSPRSYVPTTEEFERSFFGGLVTTCGLTAFGPPGSDEWGTWSQHGRVNWLPAHVSEAAVDWDAPEPHIRVSGVVREARMFGENLRLQRSWTMPIGRNQLVLRDRVVNDGGRSEPHMMLYHCNAGYPLLDEDTVWTVSQTAVTPRDLEAAKAITTWNRGGPPQADFREQVFIHEPEADARGWAFATVTNSRLRNGLSLRISYRPQQLPALFTWRMLGYGTYVMAAEPANCATIQGRVQAKHDGTLPMLKPGEAREYELRFEVLSATV